MSDDGGLLGFDPDQQAQLQAILRQMGPSDQDKAAAQKMGLLQFGLSALANVRKPTLMGLGEAGQQGVAASQQWIQQQQAQRMQNVQAAAALMPLMRQGAGLNILKQWQAGNGPQATAPQSAPVPYAPQMASNFSIQPGTQAAVGGTMNDPGGNLPPMNLSPAALPTLPPQAPRAASSSSTGIPIVDQAINVGVPSGALMAALQGPDWAATIGKLIADYGKPDNLRATGLRGHMDPSTGKYVVDFRNPQLAEGQTLDQGGAAVDVSGAQEGLMRQTMRPHVATALSTSPETIMPGGGKEYKPGVSKADILWPGGNVPGFGNIPAGSYSGKTAEVLGQLTPNFSPDEVAKIQADMGRSGITSAQMTARNPNGALAEMQVPGSAAVRSQPSPLAQRTFQTELSPQAAAESKSYGDALTKRWEEIASAGRNGAFASGRWGEMQGLANQFDSGAFTPYRARIASYFNAMGASPDTVSAVAGGSLPAMEGFGKLAFESTLNQLKSFTSRPAMQEVVLGMQNNPNIQMTVPGRNLLLQTNKALADYNVGMYKAAQQYRQAHNGSIDGFEENYYDQHPPEAVLPSLDQIEAAGKGQKVTGQPTGPLSTNATATYKAVQAAKSGKDAAAVRQRLMDNGFDPSAFDKAVSNGQR